MRKNFSLNFYLNSYFRKSLSLQKRKWLFLKAYAFPLLITLFKIFRIFYSVFFKKIEFLQKGESLTEKGKLKQNRYNLPLHKKRMFHKKLSNFNPASVFLCLICFFCISWKWQDFSLKLENRPELRFETEWVVDTVRQGALRQELVNNSPPLVHDDFVVQGNAIDGVKAYDKKTGKLLWDFYISSGVVSPLVFHKGNIYFGGADGFFYSLQLESGLLNWKYFSAVENSGPPLISEGTIYWLSNDQKIYALDLKGNLLWIYPDSQSSKGFLVRGTARPVVYKNNLYAGFQTGSLVVLNKKTGQLKWQNSFSQPIIENLKIDKQCLLVPVFNSHLFCLNRLTGKTLWKLKGGSSVYWRQPSYIYQLFEGRLFAFKDRKVLWKKKLEGSYPFPPVLVKDYLLYGFSSKGNLTVLQSRNGQYAGKYKFGKGLSAPITVQGNDIYLFSVSGYLHKLSLK